MDFLQMACFLANWWNCLVNSLLVLYNWRWKCPPIRNIKPSTCSLLSRSAWRSAQVCVGSSTLSARFCGRSSATSRHGVTNCIWYFCVSNVQCSSLEIASSWDASIFRDDGSPHLPSIYTSFTSKPYFPSVSSLGTVSVGWGVISR